jgi:hypothetical protein
MDLRGSGRAWVRSHSEEIHNSYTSPNIITVTKTRIRWAWNIARMREKKFVQNFGRET